MGSPTREFFNKIVKASPNVVVGKNYDYKCKIMENGECRVYRRKLEGMRWELYVVFHKNDVLDKEARFRYYD